MDPATTTSVPLIFINLMFALIALGIGFFAGGWFLGGKSSKKEQEEETDAEKALEERLAIERAMLATSRLKDLTHGVASDVGEHSDIVERITAELEAARGASAEMQSAQVASALEQIVDANESLQRRLAKAEQQIQAQAEEIRTHESEARTDSLTKLANRRAFDDQLNQRFAEWQRRSTPFSLIILDVDHFKKFNDTHGHQAGDEVLRQVAKAIEASARDMDISCRYGGEEFAIILPTTGAHDACGLAERVRRRIEELRVDFEGKVLSVTASVGLAEISGDDDTNALLKRADDSLYASKDAGRNCGHLHDGEQSIPIPEAGRAATKKKAAPKVEKVVTPTLDSLPNRTRFADELRRRIAEYGRSGQALSVVAIEFSAFKKLKSEYGEGVALLTLDTLAQFLRGTLREMDSLGRLDEGQLALMLPTADAEQAGMIATRASTALSGCSAPIGDVEISLEAKMGVAEFQTSDTAQSIVGRAVEDMKANKPGMATV